jgi:hypothetical protein
LWRQPLVQTCLIASGQQGQRYDTRSYVFLLDADLLVRDLVMPLQRLGCSTSSMQDTLTISPPSSLDVVVLAADRKRQVVWASLEPWCITWRQRKQSEHICKVPQPQNDPFSVDAPQFDHAQRSSSPLPYECSPKCDHRGQISPLCSRLLYKILRGQASPFVGD